jgi:SAM-dependent methyltransferase
MTEENPNYHEYEEEEQAEKALNSDSDYIDEGIDLADIDENNNEKKILNAGCGEEMYGTHRIDVFKTNATTEVGNIEEGLPYPDNFFDEVYAKNIFEHMKNPYNFLIEMKRVCKVGGRIRVITDNGNFIFYLWNLCGIKHGDYRYCGTEVRSDDAHYMFFTPEHLRNYFFKANLNIISNKLIPNVYSKRDRLIQKTISLFIGKRLGLPHIEVIAIKEEEKNDKMGTSSKF